jgi:elongation factor Ts
MATEMANQALKILLKHFSLRFHNGITIADKLIEQTGVIGEKLQINSLKNWKKLL